MKDRAAVVEHAIEAEIAAGDELRSHGALAARELAHGTTDEVGEHLRLALRSAWNEDRAGELRKMAFLTDAEATAALEVFGKDEREREAWVRQRLDDFRKSIAPPTIILDAIKAWPSTAPAPSGAPVVKPTRSTLGLGRIVVAGYGYAGSYSQGAVRATSQGHFRPLRLFIEAAADVAVPCAKCGHEAEGRKLSDLRVTSILVGCETYLASAEGIPAHLFSVRHADAPPPDPTYRVASPGITIAVTLENRGRDPIEVDVVMLGEYIESGFDRLDRLSYG